MPSKIISNKLYVFIQSHEPSLTHMSIPKQAYPNNEKNPPSLPSYTCFQVALPPIKFPITQNIYLDDFVIKDHNSICTRDCVYSLAWNIHITSHLPCHQNVFPVKWIALHRATYCLMTNQLTYMFTNILLFVLSPT